MKNKFIIALMLLVMPIFGSELKIENTEVQLVLESSTSWHIQTISFTRNTWRIAPKESFPLYQLEWFEKGKLETLNSFQAKILSANKNKDTIEIVYSHDKQRLQVKCKVWVTKDGLVWDASFKNDSNLGKAAIFRYPGIAIAKANEPLEAVLSVADGVRIRSVFEKIKENESRLWEYPGLLSSQMTAWMNGSGGAVLFAADSGGYYKRLKVFRYHDHVIPVFENIIVGIKSPEFALPYKIVLAPFKGKWEAAADVYRNWAVNQPWCRKPLKDKKLPAAAARPTFILCSHIRQLTGKTVIDQSPNIPAFSLAYQHALKMPITNLFFSWEKNGPWVAPDYFPPYPNAETFKKLSDQLHAQGTQTMVYLSGLNVTLDKTTRHGAPPFRLEGKLQNSLNASAIIGQDMKIVTQGAAQEGTGKRMILCPTTNAAKDQILNGVQKSLDYDIDLVQIDQVVGGGFPACFQEAHGHPWAGLNKLTQGFAKILQLAHEKTSAKGAALTMEEPGEYFIPYLDMVDAREYMEGTWPREGYGLEGIPLFSYLYHDFQLGFGGDAQLLKGSENLDMTLYGQAINLLAGRYPTGALWMQLPEYSGLPKQVQNVLMEIAGVWQSPAKDYLMMGQAHAIDYNFAEHPISYDVSGHSYRFTIPEFLTKAYSLGNKEIVMFINTTLRDLDLNINVLSRSKNLRVLWPTNKADQVIDTAKPIKVGSYSVLILERSR